jgi:endonuclease/exonuclease/phosphatase family metal-dependent hydrolase
MTWWSPRDAPTTKTLARWCETVGPVVFHAVPDRPAPAPLDRLVIVSWNVHVGGGDVDGVIRRLRGGEFTGGEPIDRFALLLQEAYRRDDAIPIRLSRSDAVPGRIGSTQARDADVVHLHRDDGLAVLYAPSMRNGIVDLDREDRGNAIVATFPLEDPLLVELPIERQRRVAVAATLTGTTTTGAAWHVRLADVHLDTALALTRGGPFAARERQTEALIGALSEARASTTAGETVIVAGDFNTWGGREPATQLLARAYPDAPATTDAPTWRGPLGIHATLDHVFAARGRARSIDVRRLPERFGSDHYPLLLTIRF